MSQRLSAYKGFAIRAVIASGCVAAVLFACVLSAIPQLHEEIHGVTGTANHECAVTLLTSGNYQHTPTIAISLAPPTPPTSFALALASFQVVSAHLEFSLLEHAPPAIFLTIGVSPPSRGAAALSRVPLAADPMRAERQ